MRLDYDAITAVHYAAFRPALHQIILAKCLKSGYKRERGLDIGCGTGQSAKALSYFCHNVIGLEPSAAMLAKANVYPGVNYLQLNSEKLPFREKEFDVITFAGSWYYAKSQAMLNEVFRVIKPGATIIVYDFEISLIKVLSQLGLSDYNLKTEDYDHKADFAAYDNDKMEFKSKKHESMALSLKAKDLTHLLLAQKEYYKLLEEELGSDDLFESIGNKLKIIQGSDVTEVGADLYYTIYNCKP